MKAIKIWSKTVDRAKDGNRCTPVEIAWYFHGNVLFKKGFTHRWFVWTGCCLHLLGFRFTLSVHVKY